MQLKKLGKTDLSVNPIGIGTEHLHRVPLAKLKTALNHCVDQGYNYYDLLATASDQRDRFAEAIKPLRGNMIISAHLARHGRTYQTAEASYHDWLQRLGTDCLEIVMIQWVDDRQHYEELFTPHGIYELASNLKQQGKARYIGISGHKTPVMLQAAQSGLFDVIMHPFNLATREIINPMRLGYVGDEKKALLQTCLQQGVGVVAMKVFAGGRLLEKDKPHTATVNQCMHYALSQPGVDVALAGIASMEEALPLAAYETASHAEKDYSSILLSQTQLTNLVKACVYCNHCLPCPMNIDIGQVNKLADAAALNLTDDIRQAYAQLDAHAADCIACGDCSANCPFGVDGVMQMQRALEIFGN